MEAARQTGEVDEADVDEEVLLKGLDDLSDQQGRSQPPQDSPQGEWQDDPECRKDGTYTLQVQEGQERTLFSQ